LPTGDTLVADVVRTLRGGDSRDALSLPRLGQRREASPFRGQRTTPEPADAVGVVPENLMPALHQPTYASIAAVLCALLLALLAGASLSTGGSSVTQTEWGKVRPHAFPAAGS
jgi:hypothetical protein